MGDKEKHLQPDTFAEYDTLDRVVGAMMILSEAIRHCGEHGNKPLILGRSIAIFHELVPERSELAFERPEMNALYQKLRHILYS